MKSPLKLAANEPKSSAIAANYVLSHPALSHAPHCHQECDQRGSCTDRCLHNRASHLQRIEKHRFLRLPKLGYHC